MGTTQPNPPADLSDPYDRLFVQTNMISDPLYALGKIGIVKDNRVRFTDKARLQDDCGQQDIDVTKVVMLPPKPVQSYVLSKTSKGSVGFFIGSASLSDSERYQVTLSDIATATLNPDCQLDRASAVTYASQLGEEPGTVFIYINLAVVSHLVAMKGTKFEAGGSVGIGSYFGADGGTYKGEENSISLPLLSVFGYQFQADSNNWQRFAQSSDLGLFGKDAIVSV